MDNQERTQQLQIANQSQVPIGIAVKAFFTDIDEIHRFNVTEDLTFFDFGKQLSQFYNQYMEGKSHEEKESFLEEFVKKMNVGEKEGGPAINGNDLILKYQDDEGDWIMLKSEQVYRFSFILIIYLLGMERSLKPSKTRTKWKTKSITKSSSMAQESFQNPRHVSCS